MSGIYKSLQGSVANRSGVVKLLLGVIFIVIVIGYMARLSKQPFYNSDMLAYMAIPLQMKGYTPQQIHDSVYTIAQAHVPAKDFIDLTTINQGRLERYHDYRLFYEYLRFFRLKPLYVSIIKAFYDLGINLVFATVLPSLIFTGILLAAFYFGVQKLFAGSIIPFFISVIIMLLGSANQLAVISTPDAMSSCLVFLLFLNVFFKGKEVVSYIILALCIFTRIDNLTFLPFVLYHYRFSGINMKSALKGLLLIGALSVITLVIPYFFGNHITWFKDFIFRPSEYAFMVKRSLKFMRTDFNLLFLLLIVLAYLNLSENQPLKSLFTGILLVMATRFLLFPSYEERFYFIFKLMLIFLVLADFSYRWKKNRTATTVKTGTSESQNVISGYSYS